MANASTHDLGLARGLDGYPASRRARASSGTTHHSIHDSVSGGQLGPDAAIVGAVSPTRGPWGGGKPGADLSTGLMETAQVGVIVDRPLPRVALEAEHGVEPADGKYEGIRRGVGGFAASYNRTTFVASGDSDSDSHRNHTDNDKTDDDETGSDSIDESSATLTACSLDVQLSFSSQSNKFQRPAVLCLGERHPELLREDYVQAWAGEQQRSHHPLLGPLPYGVTVEQHIQEEQNEIVAEAAQLVAVIGLPRNDFVPFYPAEIIEDEDELVQRD